MKGRGDKSFFRSIRLVLIECFVFAAVVVLFNGPVRARPVVSRAPVARMHPLVGAEFHHPIQKGFVDRRCLRRLRRLKVRFRKTRPVRGVATPVEILGGRLGSIRYRSFFGHDHMLMDCRLAVALQRASPIFRVNGVKEVLYSNFYSWRNVDGTNRLSLHALGLAVDIHGFVARNGRRVMVESDYEKGLGRGRTCEGHAETWKARLLRDLACDLDASNLFGRILTPDYDHGHRNHFHISTFHPRDRAKKRIYRTVLVDVKGVLWPWVLRRPVRARYRLSRIRRIVRRRQLMIHRWYRWHRRVARDKRWRHRRG